ncbi:hypothetical protein EVJ58_g6506 [Rhodofomes roseus]|uniref:Uncharacterized protein n=1 Tax=Rhodofomes roseus TaxID=34475 RepID=A0A4Y9Y8T9_9APHY|nr:hypothetical protein EVJ58_g6506 [Rhodofomes roseus]
MLAGIRRLEDVEIHMESTVRFDECACAGGAAAKMGLGVEWPVLRRLTLAGPSAALTAAVPIFAHAPQLSELCLSSTSASTADDALLMGALPTLRHLRTLRLEFTGRHSIDEGLSRLASAWPPEQLLELEIRWRALRNTVWTSAAILQDFAEHCRALRRLVLPPLDFQPVLSLSRASLPGNAASGVVEQKQESSLRELRLQSILLAGCDVSAAATYVERLFPTLELCEGAAPCEPVSNAWSKVEEVLKERLRIRAACTQMTSLCLRP